MLKVQFGAQIAPWEVPAFRGAIAAKVGADSLLFHNHNGDRLRYGYPLIQYKIIRRQPAIMCIGEGVEEIHKYFSQSNWNIRISGRELDMQIDRLNLHQFTMQVWEREFTYDISNWIALSQQSYQDYRQMESLQERIRLLETKLTGNILTMAKGIGWFIDRPLTCKIVHMHEPRPVKVKGVRVLAFNLRFKTNAFLPDHLGLGGKVSLGFGNVREVRDRQRHHQQREGAWKA